VDEVLRFANVSPGDVLYDLGCGDGRIVVAAAEKYGIRAVGVDIDPKRISEAQACARRHGVEDRVQFILGDAGIVDFSEATVVTLFLGADSNQRLADRLRTQLHSGARIVSRNFEMNGWAPERREESFLSNGEPAILYLWTVKKPERETAEATYSPPGAAAAG
jgi:precorrin-6B methylase 2